MKARIDHIVITVSDLETAAREYRARGFTVVAGGVHAGGLSENVLIPLGDGSYLELWCLRDSAAAHPEDRLARRFVDRAIRAGRVTDFALGVDSLELVSQGASEAGLPVYGPYPGERKRPDGALIRWRCLVPHHPLLPFFIEDVTERLARVPEAEPHGNGATGIDKLVVSGPEAVEVGAELGKIVELPGALEFEAASRPGIVLHLNSETEPIVLH